MRPKIIHFAEAWRSMPLKANKIRIPATSIWTRYQACREPTNRKKVYFWLSRNRSRTETKPSGVYDLGLTVNEYETKRLTLPVQQEKDS